MSISNYELKQKRILITGASSGIGRSTAQVCASLGATLIITGRNEERLKQTLFSLKGQNHVMFVFDYEQGVPADLVAQIEGEIDGVVHSAGVLEYVPFAFVTNQKLDRVMRINFSIPFALTQLLVKQKLIKKGGSIVFVSSISGVSTSNHGMSAYSASKGALSSVVRVLALELAKQKTRVNAICPGMVKSEMNLLSQGVAQEVLEEDERKNYPLGYGEPVDVANTICFLLSDASRWITGTNLIIDGGASIH